MVTAVSGHSPQPGAVPPSGAPAPGGTKVDHQFLQAIGSAEGAKGASGASHKGAHVSVTV